MSDYEAQAFLERHANDLEQYFGSMPEGGADIALSPARALYLRPRRSCHPVQIAKHRLVDSAFEVDEIKVPRTPRHVGEATIPDPIKNGLPDLPTNALFQYGVYEGVPRLLDLMDKHGVKLSSFMIGRAVEKAPDLAKEIVRRGHEAAAHGRTWENSYFLEADAERRFIADSVESIAKATGQTPKGWNAYWMRNSVRTLDILQSLGFAYHIDEPSRDEPFIVPLKGGDFVTVPYTFHMNDIVSFPFEGWNAAAYEQALRDEFDQLYEEGATRRRMMVVSLHDRMSGHANRVRVLDRFLAYARSKPGVWFARKDEIAAWALQHRDHTSVLDRGPASPVLSDCSAPSTSSKFVGIKPINRQS